MKGKGQDGGEGEGWKGRVVEMGSRGMEGKGSDGGEEEGWRIWDRIEVEGRV